MDRPYELLASSTPTPTMSDESTFSNLPEHIVHHILSFLEMADIVQLSFTSKSYRESCVSISSLDFDALQYPTFKRFSRPTYEYLRKVPVFAQREEAVSTLCTFQVH